MNYLESKPTGIIEYSYKNRDGVEIYDAMVETIVYDQSPRNPSLPIISSYYQDKNTVKYGLTYNEAVRHIRSFGYDGVIKSR